MPAVWEPAWFDMDDAQKFMNTDAGRTCRRCGAVVGDESQHLWFHDLTERGLLR